MSKTFLSVELFLICQYNSYNHFFATFAAKSMLPLLFATIAMLCHQLCTFFVQFFFNAFQHLHLPFVIAANILLLLLSHTFYYGKVVPKALFYCQQFKRCKAL